MIENLCCNILSQDQTNFDDLLSKIPLPIMITNRKTRVIVYANTYASDVYAVKLDKLVGSPIDIIYTNDEQREQILKAMDKEGKLNNFKTTYKKSDGSYIEALLSIVPVTYMHESCRMGIVSDITEIKNIQDELEYLNHTLEERIKEEVEKNKRQQLILFHQSRHAQMGEMIAMIAHQWRQPLNVLSLFIQKHYLKFKKGVLEEGDFETFMDKSMEQIDNMNTTIEDFRSFFKPKKESKVFNLYDTITKTVSLIEPMLKQNSIKLLLECGRDINIKGYPNEFGQALINVIKNAHDALVEKGIENKKVDIKVTQNEDKVFIVIKDNAGGIPEEKLDEIFIPYYSTREKNGTGLGLYMTKMIIEDHMGDEIDVYNDEEGAVFTISVKQINKGIK
jgi:PAS domain S-box-containing protein